jgi:hypothetical protein
MSHSKASINELVSQQVQPLWKALVQAMKNRAEMKLRINELELNNEKLVEVVGKMHNDNIELKKTLNEMEISGHTKKKKLVGSTGYCLLVFKIILGA